MYRGSLFQIALYTALCYLLEVRSDKNVVQNTKESFTYLTPITHGNPENKVSVKSDLQYEKDYQKYNTTINYKRGFSIRFADYTEDTSGKQLLKNTPTQFASTPSSEAGSPRGRAPDRTAISKQPLEPVAPQLKLSGSEKENIQRYGFPTTESYHRYDIASGKQLLKNTPTQFASTPSSEAGSPRGRAPDRTAISKQPLEPVAPQLKLSGSEKENIQRYGFPTTESYHRYDIASGKQLLKNTPTQLASTPTPFVNKTNKPKEGAFVNVRGPQVKEQEVSTNGPGFKSEIINHNRELSYKAPPGFKNPTVNGDGYPTSFHRNGKGVSILPTAFDDKNLKGPKDWLGDPNLEPKFGNKNAFDSKNHGGNKNGPLNSGSQIKPSIEIFNQYKPGYENSNGIAYQNNELKGGLNSHKANDGKPNVLAIENNDNQQRYTLPANLDKSIKGNIDLKPEIFINPYPTDNRRTQNPNIYGLKNPINGFTFEKENGQLKLDHTLQPELKSSSKSSNNMQYDFRRGKVSNIGQDLKQPHSELNDYSKLDKLKFKKNKDNADIFYLKPGENAGLPTGLSKNNMLRVLYYVFNYTVGFHRHFEEGYTNGEKIGNYYVTGRDGVRTRIDYVADDTGFHPKITNEMFDLISDDVPKPESERNAKHGLKSYKFKWFYYPIE